MSEKPELTEGKNPSFKPLMRSLALEVAFYTPLVIGYFLLTTRPNGIASGMTLRNLPGYLYPGKGVIYISLSIIYSIFPTTFNRS